MVQFYRTHVTIINWQNLPELLRETPNRQMRDSLTKLSDEELDYVVAGSNEGEGCYFIFECQEDINDGVVYREYRLRRVCIVK